MLKLLIALIPIFGLIVLWLPDLKIAFTTVIFYLIFRDMLSMMIANYQINYYVNKDRLPKETDEQIRDL